MLWVFLIDCGVGGVWRGVLGLYDLRFGWGFMDGLSLVNVVLFIVILSVVWCCKGVGV